MDPNVADSRELVTFLIGKEEFAVEIMCVREIRGWAPATLLPNAPFFVRGVINLRGAVLSIIDLAARLGYPPTEPTARHVTIVVQIGKQVVGLLVDAVTGIIAIKPDDIQPLPEIASDLARSFIKGVMPLDKRMISMIALDNVLPDQGLAEIDRKAA